MCAAANFTTTVAEAPAQDWTEAFWLPGPVSPTAGNTYEVLNGGLVRNPILGSYSTFPGDALKLDLGSTFRVKPPSPGATTIVNFPGVAGNAGLVLNGGAVNPGTTDTDFYIAGTMLVAANSVLLGPSTNGGGRNFLISAGIAGSASLTVQDFLGGSGVTVLSSSNRFAGNWVVSSGRLTGTGNASLGTGNISIASGSTFEVLYDLHSPGALTLAGNGSLMTLHQNCQFGGAIINGVALSPGTHSFEQLFSQFPGNFVAGGSGGITVLPPPTVVNLSASGASLTIAFSAGIGHTYVVQKNEHLDGTTGWTSVGSPVSGDGTVKSVQVSATAGPGFYRVWVQ